MTNEELIQRISVFLFKNIYDEISFSSFMKVSDFLSELMKEIKEEV